MEQHDLFQARRRRDEGIERVSVSNSEFLEKARGTAKLLLETRSEITSDDIRKACPYVPAHPNAWGAIFKSKDFEPTGEFRPSTFITNNARSVRVWRKSRE